MTDALLEEFLHLYGVNRGVLITPFHNMALTCPATTATQVDTHSALFDDALSAIASGRQRRSAAERSWMVLAQRAVFRSNWPLRRARNSQRPRKACRQYQ